MFRGTNRQVSLLDPGGALPPAARARLSRSWGVSFHEEVFPLLLGVEGSFSGLYAEQGRPNWSVARILGVILLQEMLDLCDQDALDALSFDLRWHRALALAADDAYLSRRSLVAFRSRLAKSDLDGTALRVLFERVVEHAVDRLGVTLTSQRLDSTHIISNIRDRSLYGLFTATVLLFTRALEQEFPAQFAAIPAPLSLWHAAQKGETEVPDVDGPVDDKLLRVARWAADLVEQFAGTPEVVATEPYCILVRLVKERVTRVEGGGPSGAKGDSREVPADPSRLVPAGGVQVAVQSSASTSLISPYDPDVGIGWKGVGYEVNITETCGNPGTELIVDYDIRRSGINDLGQAAESLDRLAVDGRKPAVLFVDAGFTSGQEILSAREVGVDLHGPVGRGHVEDKIIGRDQWVHDASTGKLLTCPAGHNVDRHGMRVLRKKEATPMAFMDGARCAACPLLGRCVVRPPKNGHSGSHWVEETRPLLERDSRLSLMKTPVWKKAYRNRAGIEATNSELKRAHGLGRLRVRRKVRARIAVATKLTACNVKRLLKAVAGK